MARFKFNFIRTTSGIIPTFYSEDKEHNWLTPTNLTWGQFLYLFNFNNTPLDLAKYFDPTTATPRPGVVSGVTVVELANGFKITFTYESNPYSGGYDCRFRFYNVNTQITAVLMQPAAAGQSGNTFSHWVIAFKEVQQNSASLLTYTAIRVPYNPPLDQNQQFNFDAWDTNLTSYLAGYLAQLNDPYATLPTNDNPGSGYGPYDYTSEVETPPSLPAQSAAQVGFVSLWNPSQAEMKDLANYLWTGTFDLTNFKKLFTDPMECVLSVGLIPITPTCEASKREIVFGGSSHSGVQAFAITEQFYIVDMGSLHITGLSQGALDYSPYAKASIYLPYCGTYALDVDEIMDSDISLEYHIDIYTGACVAYLTIDGHLNSDGKNVNAVMYQFTGNVLASIPITGNDHSQFIQSMLFMGATAAATVATSGAGAGAAAGTSADLGAETAATGFNKALAGSAINTVMSMKPNVLHSGNLSTTAGMLGGQKPFITMTWSNICKPEEEYKLVGLPLHKSGTLSEFSGFTIVSACHMDNILCTDTELQMIEQALAKGVIL